MDSGLMAKRVTHMTGFGPALARGPITRDPGQAK